MVTAQLEEVVMSEITSAAPSTRSATPEASNAGCCGGPAPKGVDACCVRDADAKASGSAGCGCDDASGTAAAAVQPRTRCC